MTLSYAIRSSSLSFPLNAMLEVCNRYTECLDEREVFDSSADSLLLYALNVGSSDHSRKIRVLRETLKALVAN